MKEKKYDLNLIITLLIFFIISLLSIYSAKNMVSITLDNIVLKQAIYYLIGTILLFITFYYKDFIIKNCMLIYIFINFLLLFLLFFGISINGSKCWIFLEPFSFQPSEFMKIFLIIVISNMFYKYETNHKKKNMKSEFILLMKIFLVMIIPSILTFLEPDTGVVIIYFIITFSLILVKGINKKWYLILAIVVIVLFSTIIITYLYNKDFLIDLMGKSFFYRVDRLFNWSNQNGYQLENSLIAIGSSGVSGFGFNKTPLYFPEASTDFIFSTYASNYGFLGSLFLILIIVMFDTTIINLCTKKINKQNKYLVIGITSMIFYQQIQNISMTIGLLPITGITLPFISYGGSSLLSYMFILGLIFNIIKKDLYNFNE